MADRNPGRRGPKLSAKRARTIFDRKIVPTLGPVVSQEHPLLLVVGGQPGAGKTSLVPAIADRLEPGRTPTILDIDKMRPFYPQYTAIKKSMGPRGDMYVGEDAFRWLKMAFEYVRERRADVIVEHTLDRVMNMIDEFTLIDDPYEVRASVLAVSGADSRLGLQARYQRAFDTTGYGRRPACSLHDQREAGVLDVLDIFDADLRISQIAVHAFRRADPVHCNRRDDHDRWEVAVPTRTVVVAERAKPWDAQRSRTWLDLHADLSARADTAGKALLAAAWNDALPLLDKATLRETHHPPGLSAAPSWEATLAAAAGHSRPAAESVTETTNSPVPPRLDPPAPATTADGIGV